ncbi:endonuclease/exonuclease/phosphatase family protein [Catalinimonas niigatensis]|uniref:endonuclease/exonuclease/phosphatase family protein n=1 Tax=Catalinimonas niigatensis TaxID=1397264 RepID=UPI00266532FF|nr:endonuclease/exonuclease/phosphatase family protein [Catalinimonas niigatensis]WPP51262.1 endonuclease/exonuclease/phosphatase family protein [Catalinimonas niigatensis]
MLRTLSHFLVAIIVANAACQSEQTESQEEMNTSTGIEQTINVMSYNIRYDNPGDSAHAWPYRKERVANLIAYHEADLLGLQEALEHQVQYLDSALNDLDWVGVGRDDGQSQGEFSPVFYRKTMFELLDWGTFWLSETPDTISVGWDAALPRIATWTQLIHKPSGDTLYYFNTHFDHRGEQAREESAKLIRKKISEIAGDSPVVVTGDFNASPDSAPYGAMVEGEDLKDAYEVSQLPHHGPTSSFSGFVVTEPLAANRRIDYVFVSPNVEVEKHAILTDSKDNAYPSDHLPVVAEVSLK